MRSLLFLLFIGVIVVAVAGYTVGQTRTSKISAQQDGSFTMTNTRNSFSKTYKVRN